MSCSNNYTLSSIKIALFTLLLYYPLGGVLGQSNISDSLWKSSFATNGVRDWASTAQNITDTNLLFDGIFKYATKLDPSKLTLVQIELDDADSLLITLRCQNIKVDTVFIEGSGYYHKITPQSFKQNKNNYIFFKTELKRYCRWGSAVINLNNSNNQILVALNMPIAAKYINDQVNNYFPKDFDTSRFITRTDGDSASLFSYNYGNFINNSLYIYIDSNVFAYSKNTLRTIVWLNLTFKDELRSDIIRPAELELRPSQILYVDNHDIKISAKDDAKLIKLIKKDAIILKKIISESSNHSIIYEEYTEKLFSVSHLLELGNDIRFNNSLEKEYFTYLFTLLKSDAKKTKSGKAFSQDLYNLLGFIYKYSYLLIDTNEISLTLNHSISTPHYTASISAGDLGYNTFDNYIDNKETSKDETLSLLPKNYIVFVNTKNKDGRPIDNYSVKWAKYRETNVARDFFGKTTPTLQRFAHIVYSYWIEDDKKNIKSPKKELDFDAVDNLNKFQKGFFTVDRGYQYLFPIPIPINTEKVRQINSFLENLKTETPSRTEWLYFTKIDITL